MWERDSNIWGDRDYLDQQDYYRNKVDEFMERKFPKKSIKENQLSKDSSNQEIK